jgi:hypothetical protein
MSTTTWVATQQQQQQQELPEAKRPRFFGDIVVDSDLGNDLENATDESPVDSEETLVAGKTGVLEESTFAETAVNLDGIANAPTVVEWTVIAENADGAASAENSTGLHDSTAIENEATAEQNTVNGTHATTESHQSNGINNVNNLATTQRALLLHAVKEKYSLVTDHAVPSIIHDGEVLIKVNLPQTTTRRLS